MGDGLSTEFTRFVGERRLVKARVSRGMILKELEAALSDLGDARDSGRAGEVKVGNHTGLLLDVPQLQGLALR
jgi:hypothetical protein